MHAVGDKQRNARVSENIGRVPREAGEQEDGCRSARSQRSREMRKALHQAATSRASPLRASNMSCSRGANRVEIGSITHNYPILVI